MYRINPFEIHLPPLRDRISDIPELARHLYRRFRPAAKPDDRLFTSEAIEMLQSHVWPGNVRELANVIEHALIVNSTPPVTPDDLPRHFASRSVRRRTLGPINLRDLEMQAIQESLDRHGGNKSAAAEELGISLKTLYNKLNQASALEKSA
jgi:two-component system NtrC family response regulator